MSVGSEFHSGVGMARPWSRLGREREPASPPAQGRPCRYYRYNSRITIVTGRLPGGIPPASITQPCRVRAADARSGSQGIAAAGPHGRCRDDPSSGAAGTLDEMRSPPSHASGLGNSRDGGPAPELV